jgi:hypothetical protein
MAHIICPTAYIGTCPTIIVSCFCGGRYGHPLSYNFYGLTGTAVVEVNNSKITDFSWPLELYKMIPNAKSGEGTLWYTCPDDGGVDFTVSTTFTVLANEQYCTPTIGVTITDSNEVTKALTGDETKLIRYHSTAQLVIDAEAKNYATIVNCTAKNGSNSFTGESGSFEKVESAEFTISTEDSRGFSTSVGRDLAVAGRFINYIRPTCYMSNTRPDTDGNMSVICYGNFFNDSFGAVDNTVTAEYRYAPVGGAYSAWQPMTAIINDNNTYSAVASLSGLDYQTTYMFETRVTDKLETVTSTSSGVKSLPVFHWSENDFAFEVPVALNGGLSGGVEGDLNVTGDLRLKGSGNYGNTLRFGDGDYCYIAEPKDDELFIKAGRIDLSASGVYVYGNPIPDMGTGVWTPALNSSVVSSYSTQYGWYSKLGQTVSVGFYIKANCYSGYQNTEVEISGLPFTPMFASGGGGMCSGAYVSGGFNFQCFVAETSGKITTRVQACNNASATNLSTSASGCFFPSGGGEITLSGTITYMSNS